VVNNNGRDSSWSWQRFNSASMPGAPRLGTNRHRHQGRFQQRPNEIRLKRDLMDKQIVDIDGRK